MAQPGPAMDFMLKRLRMQLGRGGAGQGEARRREEEGGEGREETDKLTTAITVPRLHPTELPISSVDLYKSHSPRL